MESIEILNKRLIEYYSVAWNNMPMWRIVWSEDQFEKRLTDCDDNGIFLPYPQFRNLPKYRQWITHKYVLEQLSVVPEINQNELVEKLSYEPLYVFEDKQGNALPPKWEAAKFVIDSILAVKGKESMFAKYTDPDSHPENAIENQGERIRGIEEALFGNESNVGDALAHNQAIIVPRNYEKEG